MRSGCFLVRALFLTCRWPPSHFSHGLSSVPSWRGSNLWGFPLFFVDNSPIRLGPHRHVTLITILQAPLPNTVTLGIKVSPYEFGTGQGGHNSVHSTPQGQQPGLALFQVSSQGLAHSRAGRMSHGGNPFYKSLTCYPACAWG